VFSIHSTTARVSHGVLPNAQGVSRDGAAARCPVPPSLHSEHQSGWEDPRTGLGQLSVAEPSPAQSSSFRSLGRHRLSKMPRHCIAPIVAQIPPLFFPAAASRPRREVGASPTPACSVPAQPSSAQPSPAQPSAYNNKPKLMIPK